MAAITQYSSVISEAVPSLPGMLPAGVRQLQ